MRTQEINRFVKEYIENDGCIKNKDFLRDDMPDQLKAEYVDLSWALYFYVEQTCSNNESESTPIDNLVITEEVIKFKDGTFQRISDNNGVIYTEQLLPAGVTWNISYEKLLGGFVCNKCGCVKPRIPDKMTARSLNCTYKQWVARVGRESKR